MLSDPFEGFPLGIYIEAIIMGKAETLGPDKSGLNPGSITYTRCVTSGKLYNLSRLHL